MVIGSINDSVIDPGGSVSTETETYSEVDGGLNLSEGVTRDLEQ